MDKGLKSDAKIVEAKIPKTEPVRPPKDKPRVFKKVIKKIEKPKLSTIGDKPKPRTDKPIQGPAKIKRPRPAKGSPGVKYVEDADVPDYSKVSNKSETTQTGSNTNKRRARFYREGN